MAAREIRDALEWVSRQDGHEATFIGWHPRDLSPSWETAAARGMVDELFRLGARPGRPRRNKMTALRDAEIAKVEAR
jgi:hypothetical protein